jgi:YVTN family beta-propeller protein
MQQIGFVPTGAGAHGLVISRDATRLYVSNRLAGTISVIDPSTQKVVDTWNVGGSPDMLSVSTDGSQLWTSNRFDGSVSVIDTATGKVLKVIKTGDAPHGLVYYPQPGNLSLGHNGVFR